MFATICTVEVFLRVLTSITNLYDVEMVKYAKKLKISSPYEGISHIHKPNVSAQLMGAKISLNSHGHRNPELSATKKIEETRLLTIGSSMAMGWGVEEDKTFTSITVQRLNDELASKFNKKFVGINAGVGNYNAANSIQLFKKQLNYTSPDIVVFQYYMNDAEPNPIGTSNALVKHSLLFAFLSVRLQQMMFVSSSNTLDGYYNNLYSLESSSWINAQNAIKELVEICNENNIFLVALMIPEMHNLSAGGPYPRIYNMIESLFSDLGVEFVSSYPALSVAFANNPRAAWVAKDDPHPSAEAHQIIADTLYDHLVASLQ